MQVRVIYTIILFVLASFGVSAQTREWSELRGRRLVKFSWTCSTPAAYPSAKLNRIVKRTMKREQFDGFGTWGDRAIAFDLNGDHRPEYFVPLDCGGTGNCYWGVYALNPARELGMINGEYLYVHRVVGRWPNLITYGHVTAMEGSLTTYRFNRTQRYVTRSRYPINNGVSFLEIQQSTGIKMPAFLERAKRGCESLDN
jgi:hypothetical protein